MVMKFNHSMVVFTYIVRIKMKKKVIIVGILLMATLGIWVAINIRSNNQIEKLPAKPSGQSYSDASAVLWSLENNEPVNYDLLIEACDFVDARYDKADFTISVLIRIMYDYEDQLPEDIRGRMEETFLDFKYWMDQPGEDSMCYWSENHQILFASSEYLVGQLYPDTTFYNDGRLGSEHMDEAASRINIWLEQRFLYGFSEWYSNVYYKEDLLALSQLLDFASDELMVEQAKMITDLLLIDVATQSYEGVFISTSGRLYEVQKKSGHGNRLNRVAEYLWGFDLESKDKAGGLDLSFIYTKNYDVPQVITEIALDKSERIIKASNGLDVSELKDKGLIGHDDEQIMMQWGMEAFTNEEIIHNSMSYINDNGLLSNEFLHDFKLMNIDILKNGFALPIISRVLNLPTNGVALQRANTYTYKTKDYMLATAQSYQPGENGDQHHIFSATLNNDISVFTTHPAVPLEDKGALSGSPNYWVGSGRLPHSVQHENINLTMYVLPDKKSLMEDVLVHYTHAYFPSELMDEVKHEGHYIFGKTGDTYIAIIGKNALTYEEGDMDDLIQDGQVTYWITELSSTDEESFEAFVERIKSNEVTFDEKDNELVYISNDITIALEYGEGFSVNGEMVDTNYMRHESDYGNNERETGVIVFEYNGKQLSLDFYNGERTE